MRKYRMTRDLLTAGGGFDFEASPLAGADVISLVHDRGYVNAFLDGTIDFRLMRRIGFPWSPELVVRTRASVGGTLAAAEQALRNGWGGTLSGGTHHAFRAEGAGFCVFNDIAVAIESLRQRGCVRRVAVVDLDVHQGDGTAQIFQGDHQVLTLSVHGKNNFPFNKQRSFMDIELEDETSDEVYLRRLSDVLPLVFAFDPEMVFYQSGVDGLREDRLGRLALTHDGLLARDRMVFDLVRRLGVPLVITQGGGYAEPIELTAQAHANTFRLARDVFAG